MSRSKSILPTRPFLALLLGLGSLLPPALAGTPAQQPKTPTVTVAGLPPEKALAMGERIYREGILPSGDPMESSLSRDTKVAGISFACASCHLRSGVGSVEGGVVTLPITGFKLAQSRYWKYQNLLPEERKNLRVQTPAARPPYTDATLARLIRTGVDASGRELKTSMPRYNLKADDMAILVHYLWSLSATPSPGAEGDTIRFATVISDEVTVEDQQAMLVPMNNYVARHNTHASGMGNRMYMSIGGKEMAGSYRKLSLAVWRLKGAPETWKSQLEAYQAKEPVFALLGGIAHGDWKPIHAFCEAQKLPCLFPLTDLPVMSETDWYTQYFSKGYYQEGEAAARYLSSLDDQGPTARILQIVQAGPEGRELARGFHETWQELGQGEVKEIRLKHCETLGAAALQDLLRQEKPTSVLLWTGAGAFGALESLADSTGRPGRVFMSSRLLGSQLQAIPEKARPFTLVTYPYREPQDEAKVSRYANSLMAGLPTHRPETRISTRTYSMLQLFQAALVEMDRNLYRDNFLDRLGLLRDYVLPDYLRLSFGAGQRYASKGCFIMQLGPGVEPKLIRKSEWVIY